MANNIKVKISLPTQQELQKQLESLISKAQNVNIPLDVDTAKLIRNMNDMAKEIDKIKSQLSSIGNTNISTNGLDKIKGNLGEIEKELTKIGNYNILEKGNTIVDDKIVNTYVKIKDELGNIIKLTEQNGTVTRTMVEPIEKLEQAEQRYIEQIYKANDALDVKKMKLQETLDGLYARGNVSESQLNSTGLDELISNLNLGSTASDFERINQLLREQLSAEKEIIATKKQSQKETANAIKEQLDLADKVEKVKDKYNAQLDVIEKVNEAFLKSSKGSGLQTELEKLRTEVNNLNPANISELNSQVSKLDSTIKSTSADVKTMGQEWSLATQSANTFTGAIGEALKKIGVFSIGYDLINGIENQFKDGVQSVIEMDSALADLNKVVSLSKSEMIDMRDASVSLGQELGRSAVDITQGMAEFGRQYKDLEQIKEMTRASVIGANVMDIDSGTVASSLTTIISSMKLEANEAMEIIDKLNEVTKWLNYE